MRDPAFDPITATELWWLLVIFTTLTVASGLIVQWQRNVNARKLGRANHPTSKGLPRK